MGVKSCPVCGDAIAGPLCDECASKVAVERVELPAKREAERARDRERDERIAASRARAQEIDAMPKYVQRPGGKVHYCATGWLPPCGAFWIRRGNERRVQAPSTRMACVKCFAEVAS